MTEREHKQLNGVICLCLFLKMEGVVIKVIRRVMVEAELSYFITRVELVKPKDKAYLLKIQTTQNDFHPIQQDFFKFYFT